MGVTRGKRLVVLVGQRKALAIAVKGASARRRWSKLSEWHEERRFARRLFASAALFQVLDGVQVIRRGRCAATRTRWCRCCSPRSATGAWVRLAAAGVPARLRRGRTVVEARARACRRCRAADPATELDRAAARRPSRSGRAVLSAAPQGRSERRGGMDPGESKCVWGSHQVGSVAGAAAGVPGKTARSSAAPAAGGCVRRTAKTAAASPTATKPPNSEIMPNAFRYGSTSPS
jgi:hypothetical protein